MEKTNRWFYSDLICQAGDIMVYIMVIPGELWKWSYGRAAAKEWNDNLSGRGRL